MSLSLSLVPVRWQMACLLFSGALVAYTQRVNVSVASAQMLLDLDWSLTQKGFVLSAFYWGYTAGQLPAPLAVRHLGPKTVFLASIVLSSLATLCLPVCARASYALALCVLGLVGLFQAMVFPAVYQFIPLWIPLEEKTVMVPFIYAGCSVGNIVGLCVCSRVINTDLLVGDAQLGGWDACFYVFGLLGLAWAPLFLLGAYDSPAVHPWIAPEEVALINAGKLFAGTREKDALSLAHTDTDTERDRERDDASSKAMLWPSLSPELPRSRSQSASSSGASPYRLPNVHRHMSIPEGDNEEEEEEEDNEGNAEEEEVLNSLGERDRLSGELRLEVELSPVSCRAVKRSYAHSSANNNDTQENIGNNNANNDDVHVSMIGVDDRGSDGSACEENNQNDTQTHAETQNISKRSTGRHSSDAFDSPQPYTLKSTFHRAYSNQETHDTSHRSRTVSFSPLPPTVTNTGSSPIPAYLSVKYRRYEDDHLEHEFSEPIALENLGCNMIASASSRVARVDGMSTKFPGRPRTLTIISQVSHRKKMAEDTPWLNFITHPVSLTLFLNSWCSGWLSYTLMSEMPAFLSDALGFDLSKAGLLCVFPYVALAVCSLSCGGFFEFLQNERGWSTDLVRRSGEFIAFIVSSVCLIICAFLSDPYGAYIFMIFTQGLTGAIQVGLACAYSDVAPNYSSSLNTIGNIIGSVAGIAGPLVVSALLTAEPGIWGWRIAFFLTFAQCVIAMIFWLLFQTSKPVPELNCGRSEGLGAYKRLEREESSMC